MKRIAFLIFIFGTVFSLKAQIYRGFTADETAFLEEAQNFFLFDRNATKKQQSEAQKLIERFTILYDALHQTEQKAFSEMAQAAALANLRPFPGFYDLLRSACGFYDAGQQAVSYNAYVECLKKIAESKRIRDFDLLVQTANRVLEKQTLYESLAAVWKIDGEFVFQYKDAVPKFTFDATNLWCFANGDSTRIHLTKGSYQPITFQWEGLSGLVDYERAGYNLSEMFIQLNDYTINMRTSRYTADSVNFFNKIYFNKPLFGRMEEKVLPPVRGGQVSYPYFESYDKRLEIRDVFENVDFEGRYIQAGARVKCGDKDEKALLKFRQQNENILIVQAQNFIFSKDRISAPLSQVIIPLGEDTIFHPSCDVRFDHLKREISILHPRTGSFENPVFNSYHKLDMYFEALYWNIDSTQMDFRMLRIPNRESVAMFESKDYYSPEVVQDILSIADYNPLYVLRKASEYYNSTVLSIETVAEYFRMDVIQTKVLMLKIASKGFLFYDPDAGQITIQNKLFHFLQASAKKADYDVIRFESVRNNESNAILDLKTRDLHIFGVEKVTLSDVQNVYVMPDYETVTVKKDRNFHFSGFVHGGKFDFIASGCRFIYDDFKILLDTINVLAFSVKYGTPDIYGNYPLRRVETNIEKLSGEILIDSIVNKSGQQRYPDYPVFLSYKDAYVYYDKPFIQNGVYNSDKFHYIIYPFRLDRMNDFDVDQLRFEGHLVAARIFPDIYEDLKVMPDFSLGFSTYVADSAWPVYGGLAKFYDTISLSNAGLIGSGRLEFITSTSISNAFVFMPDSMNAVVKTFDVAAQTIGPEFPIAKAKTVRQHWEPYRNRLKASNIADAFEVFDGDALFSGEMTMSPEGISANGRLIFENNSEVKSESFIFKHREATSPDADFQIRSQDGKNIAVESQHYMARINFDQRKADFETKDENSVLGFPINQYLCYMDVLEWNMDDDRVFFKNSKKSSFTDEQLDQMSVRELMNADLPGSDFVSLNPRQDSLTFNAPLAEYNLERNELHIQQVRLIYTADIAVHPADGNILIGKNAIIEPFENAVLLLDVESQYHDIYNATIQILGKYQYKADGFYDYVDKNKSKQAIYFEKIAPNKDGVSEALAKIAPEDNFALSPAFNYQGKITLHADQDLLYFDGSTQINHACEEDDMRGWLSFQSEIDPDSIGIPLELPLKDKGGKRLGSGFYATPQGDLFASFLSPIRSTDLPVLVRGGFLQYDDSQNAYTISQSEDPSPDYAISLNDKSCFMKAYGATNFQLKTGRLAIDNFGRLSYDFNSYTSLFDGVINLDFFFNDKSLRVLQASVEKSSGDGAEVNTDKFVDYLFEKCGDRDAERLLNEIELYGAYRRIPSQIKSAILFSDVKMRWDDATRSWVSIGPLGIAHIGDVQINKKVNGTLQIIKSRRGDVINLYIEISRREWYFFSYSDGVMQSLSSQDEFNEPILSAKAKSRRQGGLGSRYEYTISTLRKRSDFLTRVNAAKNNTEEDIEQDYYEDEEDSGELLEEGDEEGDEEVEEEYEEEEDN